ncbi:iron (III) transport system, permease protein putative [Candidatus Endolissoclinum faulkneri L5]|uniref:Iron (III) transport system, permease protein putative n=1 Tax=Candidatus Endolissoclinum faulkneri L5 TaxID=1401328 RepID=V9TSN8_9PROT|nr:iron ABC transporter permease [Candidatus Endolissoclinum faulkneri]AHC73934.1 iron (III) transport system, permease protein putative [Candidatus Endolissoclinum faulkneri L5]
MPLHYRFFLVASIICALLVAAPILTVFLHAMAPTELIFHLYNTLLPTYISNTILLIIGVTLGTGSIGVGTAWLVTMCRFPGRCIMEWALVLPLAAPTYVLAYAYANFLEHAGPVQELLRQMFYLKPRDYWFPEIRSLGGVIVMLTITLFPYVYLLARAAFLEQSVCVIEVSRTLGKTPVQTFMRIALPLARPAIAAGIALAVMETLADYGTVSYFGVQTFTTGVYLAIFSFGDRVAAAQLASGLLIFVIIVIFMERISRGRQRFDHTTNIYRKLPIFRLSKMKAAGALTACALPVFLGFLLPTILLIHMTTTNGHKVFGIRYITMTINSATLAGITSVLAVFISLLMAYTNRLSKDSCTILLSKLAALGYAVPSSVIAIGILIPISLFDRCVDDATRHILGLSTGLLMSGSAVSLIYAYLVRFLAVSLHTIEAGMTKITPNMDKAAQVLGNSPRSILKRVHLPMLRSSLLTATLIVFVDVMKELPATMILRPFNFNTLAVQAHNLAADERISQAATPSLTILVVGLLPVILLSWHISKSRTLCQ